jgi:hypothetical protein
MNGPLLPETAQARMRVLVHFFAVMMCCIGSDASFFHVQWPLFVSAPELTIGSEK